MKKTTISLDPPSGSLALVPRDLPDHLQRAGLRLAALILRPTAADPVPPLVPAADHLVAFCTDLVRELAAELEHLWLARPVSAVARFFAVDSGRRLYLALAEEDRTLMVELSTLALVLLQQDGSDEEPSLAHALQAFALQEPVRTPPTGEAAGLEVVVHTLHQIASGLLETQAPQVVRAWSPRLQTWVLDPAVRTLPPAQEVR